MKYNFDEIIPRRGTNSYKWDSAEDADVLPMWVADMDFRTAPPVVEALKKRVEHGIFGYVRVPDVYYEAVVNWFVRRHAWRIEKEWIIYTTGVVPAISAVIKALTLPGDKVMVQSPVYNCFFSSIRNNGCEMIANPLVYRNRGYQIDFDDLEKKAKDPKNKMLILCSPHNPIGRVWTREELEKVGRICIDNNVLVVSDEIHFDFILTGHKHTVFANISEEFAQHCIICTAPSKTFNIAGLKISNIVIPNDHLRKQLLEKNQRDFASNALGIQACRICYDDCGAWKDEMLCMIEYNYQQVKKFVEEKLPQIKVIELQGTYLLWLDCTALGLSDEELEKLTLGADLYLDEGYLFGPGGSGFERINLACPTRYLMAAMERFQKAISALK